jgi:uncharacterized damage-inducible protein DinB
MQLSPGEAKLIAGFLLSEYESERATTAKVLEAIPADRQDYAPDAKSRTALQLAVHLVTSECHFLEAVRLGARPAAESKAAASFQSVQEAVAWANARIPDRIDQVKSLSGEALCRSVVFSPQWSAPAYAVLQLMLKHSIHHRGQLAAYLRPMGAIVPSIYGPSADSR